MQGAVVEAIQFSTGGLLQQGVQALQSLDLESSSGRLLQEQAQVLAQQSGAEVGVAVVTIEHPLQLLVEGGGVERRGPQDGHECLHRHAGLLHQPQGQRESVGEAGDELIQRKLGGGAAADRSHQHRLL